MQNKIIFLIFSLFLIGCMASEQNPGNNSEIPLLKSIPESWNGRYSFGESNSELAIVINAGKIFEADGTTIVFPLGTGSVAYQEEKCSENRDGIIIEYKLNKSTNELLYTKTGGLEVLFKKIDDEVSFQRKIQKLEENIIFTDTVSAANKYYSFEPIKNMEYSIKVLKFRSDSKFKISVYSNEELTNSYFQDFSTTEDVKVKSPTGGKIFIKLYCLDANAGFSIACVTNFANLELKEGELEVDYDVTSDFGKVNINDTVKKTFTIKNTGNTSLSINRISMKTIDYEFSTYLLRNLIPPQGSTELRVEFSPKTAGMKNEVITIESNDFFNPKYFLQFKGEACLPPVILITNNGTNDMETGSEYNFGSVGVDSFSILTLTIENKANGVLKIIKTELSTQDETAFSIVEGGNLEIMPQEKSQIKIKFKPTKVKKYSCNLFIDNNTTNSKNYSITLSGSGIIGTGGFHWEF